MPPPPLFESTAAFVARRGDVAFWRSHVVAVVARHGYDTRPPLHAGTGATFPTFLCGDVVVKIFGFWPRWRASLRAEDAAHAALAQDDAIRAPRILATGALDADGPVPWPYRVTTRMAGVPWARAGLGAGERPAVARALGDQLARVRRLPPDGLATPDDWSDLDLHATLARSSLPRRLLGEVDGFLAAVGPGERAVVHGDLTGQHVFVANGRLEGVIDWGDAIVTDPHYELAKLHLDLFEGDRALLAAFLEGAGRPIGDDFARRALATALRRQAHGCAQHDRMDVFHKLPRILGDRRVEDLDDLAHTLFAP
jgi:aminoglycoside phosphotransferase (APT) family kinase protein